MGIPTFFIRIVKNQKKNYKNVYYPGVNGKIECDYMFFDYNGIIYGAYERVKKANQGKKLTRDKFEELLIEEVIRYTKYVICDVVKPQVVTYLSFDGPAPRAKMVQQRSRRYKTYYDKIYFQNEKKKYNLEEDAVDWDTSSNISPGTKFMHTLSQKILEAMKSKYFSDHNPKMKVILSDSNFPGEGEHKFMNVIRSMKNIKTKMDSKIYIFSKDADLIVLATSSHKNNIHILREVAGESDKMLKKMYEGKEYLILNIDNLSAGFNHELTKTFEGHQFDKLRILNDYMFLTFLVGNDFVPSLPFLKIRNDGLEILIAIYHDIKLKHSGYLFDIDNDKNNDAKKVKINILFFKELIHELSLKEDHLMKEQQKDLTRLLNGYKDQRTIESEAKMTPFEIFSSRYVHMKVCSPEHPLFSKYHEEFKKIDYNLEYEEWKNQYYQYYFNISKSNIDEYNRIRVNCVKNYFESIVFSSRYYYIECPSWNWHYKFRVSPLLSDMLYVLENNLIDINNMEFDLAQPYTPFQQLMLIYPPQMDYLVPAPLRPIMNDDKLLCSQFYPIDFRLDVAAGIKTQYSEAILPEIDEDLLIPVVKKMEEKLTPEEKERNMVREKIFML
jgi:5'-3' exonuclease